MAVYGGSIYDYSWSTSGKTVTVVDNSTRNGDSGTDVLQKIEALRFNDGEVLLGKTNNAPVVTAENVSVSEDGTVGFTVTGIDFDKDMMSISDVAYTGSGDYTITGVTNTPNSNHSVFVASVSFATSGGFESLAFGETKVEQIVFTLSDGNGGFTSKTVDITITGENDDPVAQAGTASGDEDTVISGSVAASDVDGDTLTFALATDGANGSVVMAADGSYTYTPVADFNGTDSFTYTVSDGNGGTDTQTVNITVNAVNDAPVAQAGTASGDEDTVISGTVAASDVDGDTLTFALATDGANGSVVMAADGSYAYTPDADFNGTDSFTYTVSDGNGGTDTQTVRIRVDAVNDAPVAQAGTASGDEDTVISGTLLASDVDGDTLRFAVETQATHGTVAIRPDGSYAYTPGANFNGTDSFTYTVSDGNGGTDTQTVNITVNAVNDAPEGLTSELEVDEDGTLSGVLLARDIDGDSLTFSLGTAASNGVVTVAADGSFTYTPSANYFGTDSFAYTVDDGNGGVVSKTVLIDVASVNDAPVQTAPVPDKLVNEADGMASVDLSSFVSDLETANLSFSTVSLVDSSTGRSVAIGTSFTGGVLSFNPSELGLALGDTFDGVFTIRVDDGSGAANSTTQISFNLTVNGSNDPTPINTNNAPVATDLVLRKGDIEPIVIDLKELATDADGGDVLSFGNIVISGSGREGSVTYSLSDGVLTIDPAQFNIEPDESTGVAPEVELEISFDVNDGAGKANSVDTGTIQLTIEDGPGPVEEPDTPNSQPEFADTVINESATDRNIVIDLSEYASDADLDDLSFSVAITGGTDLDYELRGTKLHIAYTDSDIIGLGAGDSISTEFTVTVDDNTGSANAINTGTVTVNIDGPFTPSPAENRAPVISGPIYGLEVVTDGYDLVTYVDTTGGPAEVNRSHVVGTVVSFDLDTFANDADGDEISFSDVSVTIGSLEDGGVPTTISSSFDSLTNELTFDLADVGLADGQEVSVALNFTVTDDSGAANASTTGSVTVAASDPADGVPVARTFDFEEYSSESGNTIPIGGVDGFVFSGSSTVFETDESSSDPERPNLVGLANGQTSLNGDNVLATSVDEAGGKFGIYADTATQRVANDEVFIATYPPGFGSNFDPDNYGFEGEFNLESVSINPAASDNVTIRIVSYRAEIVEVPNGSNTDYYADYVEVDTFDFILDASTVATSINFGDTLFDDPSVDYDSKFDGINAVEIYALDGSAVVIDDLTLTPV
ncbi:MAG: tandem-95 repeat protein [Rhodobacteraceae bacterium]|nr:tandem-95 repeat protein [Paracoccaceae bacterium]